MPILTSGLNGWKGVTRNGWRTFGDRPVCDHGSGRAVCMVGMGSQGMSLWSSKTAISIPRAALKDGGIYNHLSERVCSCAVGGIAAFLEDVDTGLNCHLVACVGGCVVNIKPGWVKTTGLTILRPSHSVARIAQPPTVDHRVWGYRVRMSSMRRARHSRLR
jgi:hypothetical protein